MVNIEESDKFFKICQKIKDSMLKMQIKKQIKKIINNPEVGKPMRNIRKGIMELYIKPFRLSYSYFKDEDRIVLLDLYHKKQQ